LDFGPREFVRGGTPQSVQGTCCWLGSRNDEHAHPLSAKSAILRHVRAIDPHPMRRVTGRLSRPFGENCCVTGAILLSLVTPAQPEVRWRCDIVLTPKSKLRRFSSDYWYLNEPTVSVDGDTNPAPIDLSMVYNGCAWDPYHERFTEQALNSVAGQDRLEARFERPLSCVTARCTQPGLEGTEGE